MVERDEISMRRSHLEIYIEILTLLSQNGPQKRTHIMQKTNLNFKVLTENLSFLVKQALVEERNIGKAKEVFAVTQQGNNVVKFFSELNKTLPITEGAQNKVPL
jgi:predicted transcriptional regulator